MPVLIKTFPFLSLDNSLSESRPVRIPKVRPCTSAYLQADIALGWYTASLKIWESKAKYCELCLHLPGPLGWL